MRFRSCPGRAVAAGLSARPGDHTGDPLEGRVGIRMRPRRLRGPSLLRRAGGWLDGGARKTVRCREADAPGTGPPSGRPPSKPILKSSSAVCISRLPLSSWKAQGPYAGA